MPARKKVENRITPPNFVLENPSGKRPRRMNNPTEINTGIVVILEKSDFSTQSTSFFIFYIEFKFMLRGKWIYGENVTAQNIAAK